MPILTADKLHTHVHPQHTHVLEFIHILLLVRACQVPYRVPFPPEEAGGDPHASAAYAVAAGAAESSGRQELHTLRLLDLQNLTPVGPAGGVNLEPGEAVTALRSVRLTRWVSCCVCE